MSEKYVVALIAGMLLGADRIAQQTFYLQHHDPNYYPIREPLSEDDAIGQARALLNRAQEAV